MPDWLTLLGETGEYTPGPWTVELPTAKMPNHPALVKAHYEGASVVLAVVNKRRVWTTYELAEGAEPTDPERDTNALMFADSQMMLALLARWATRATSSGTNTPARDDELTALVDDTVAMVRRYVRLPSIPQEEEGENPSYDAWKERQQSHEEWINRTRAERGE